MRIAHAGVRNLREVIHCATTIATKAFAGVRTAGGNADLVLSVFLATFPAARRVDTLFALAARPALSVNAAWTSTSLQECRALSGSAAGQWQCIEHIGSSDNNK
jgi:hypothetical protein